MPYKTKKDEAGHLLISHQLPGGKWSSWAIVKGKKLPSMPDREPRVRERTTAEPRSSIPTPVPPTSKIPTPVTKKPDSGKVINKRKKRGG